MTIKKFLLLALCPILALISCTKETSLKKENKNGSGEYLINLRINIPTATTKAPGDTFNEGNELEYNVDHSNSYLIFYSSEKMELVRYRLDNEDAGTFWYNFNTGENITQTGTVRFKSSVKPKYVVCLLNIPDKLNDFGCDNLKKFITKPADGTVVANNYGLKSSINSLFAPTESKAGNNTGFYMTNSTYYTETSEPGELTSTKTIIQEIEIKDDQILEVTNENYYEEPTNDIEIYVERVVAKVSVNDKITTKTINDGEKDIEIEIVSWSLNATNRSFAQIKKIDANTNLGSSSGLIGFGAAPISWNNESNYRSHWAIDNNYNATDANYPTNSSFEGTQINNNENCYLNYYSLNQTDNSFTEGSTKPNYEYCFENTVENNVSEDLTKKLNALTHVIVKAHYDTKETETPSTEKGVCTFKDVFRIDGSKILYSYTNFRKDALNKLNSLLSTNGINVTVTENDIKITRDAENYKDRADVKPTISYIGTENLGKYEEKKTNLNELLYPSAQIWVFPQGYCYYAIPIHQFKVQGGFGELTFTQLIYGIVRNHWYVVNIEKILDFGEPADPDKPIIPEPNDEKLYKITSNVNVLSWAVVEQSADLTR